MTPDIKELRALAEKATPGPWYQTGAPWFRDGTGVLCGSPDGNVAYLIADTDDFSLPREEYDGFPLGDKEDDAAFIAAANPSTILSLLDQLEAAQSELASLKAQAGEVEMREGVIEAERKRAAAAIHWVFSADGTKGERSMADEAINKINDPTFLPASPRAEADK